MQSKLLWALAAVLGLGVAAATAGCALRQTKRAPSAWTLADLVEFCKSGGTGEEGGPQSRLYRGGCLEKFIYFYDPNGAAPAPTIPQLVRGVGTGTPRPMPIRLERAGPWEVKPGHVLQLYEPIVDTTEGPKNLCEGERNEGAESLDGKAFVAPGYWDKTDSYYGEAENRKAFALSCATGAIGKCIRGGYSPWSEDPEEVELYEACLHASRGEFKKGSRNSYTCAGTWIDVIDHKGIQAQDRTARTAQFTFEAAWGKEGIICMNHARYVGCEHELENTPRCPTDLGLDDWREVYGSPVLIKTRSAEGVSTRLRLCPSSSKVCQ